MTGLFVIGSTYLSELDRTGKRKVFLGIDCVQQKEKGEIFQSVPVAFHIKISYSASWLILIRFII